MAKTKPKDTEEIIEGYDDEAFEALLKKRFGDDLLTNLDEAPVASEPGNFVPTPSESLNLALGIGGIARGCVGEIWGPSGTGKTTLVIEIAKQFQRIHGPIGYIDVENILDRNYASNLGLDLSRAKCKFSQEQQTEEVLNVVNFMAEAGLSVIIVDSLAALIPRDNDEEPDATKAKYAGNAKAMSTALPRIISSCRETGASVIFLNQVRNSMNMYGSNDTRPGGKALEFYAGWRLKLAKASPQPPHLADKDSKGNEIGVQIKVKVEKNKFARPNTFANYDIIYGRGIDRIGNIVELLVEKGLVTKGGAWYTYEDQKWQGLEAVKKYFYENQEQAEALAVEVRERFRIK